MTDLLKAADAMAEALRSFSKMADAYDPFEEDDFELCWDRRPNLGELRRAREALSAYEAAKREAMAPLLKCDYCGAWRSKPCGEDCVWPSSPLAKGHIP